MLQLEESVNIPNTFTPKIDVIPYSIKKSVSLNEIKYIVTTVCPHTFIQASLPTAIIPKRFSFFTVWLIHYHCEVTLWQSFPNSVNGKRISPGGNEKFWWGKGFYLVEGI